MTLGKEAVQSISQEQKLNTKSSTEAELVGADDVLIHLMWMKYFLEAQGYGAKQTILSQDNEISTFAILTHDRRRHVSHFGDVWKGQLAVCNE